MKCNECKRRYRENFFNVHKFSMNLYQRETYPHANLDFEVVSFFDSTEGDICESTFSLYLDKDMGKADGFGDWEKILCEDVSISQLERIYHFLDLIINKAHKLK